MVFLYDEISTLRQCGHILEVPPCILKNLNPYFKLRSYQLNAFENFITYFENDNLRQKPTQVLFHMATGSGKTLIMAGLILYLYRKGYRNFLFFVNLNNIIEKTKDNFKNGLSKKYLFADEIVIDGERIEIQEVENFQYTDPNKINICFSTTNALCKMSDPKEDTITFDDFDGQKVVLIGDEAHHLNADTLTEEAEDRSWEKTVDTIFKKNEENILLEFTATCDLQKSAIKEKYQDKIIFNYPLKDYYVDKYSKDILILRSELPETERVLQALVLSQYRLKVFQDHRRSVKPVVLFKSQTIDKSKAFFERFSQRISRLTGDDLRFLGKVDNPIIQKALEYFKRKGIDFESLARELQDDFSRERCFSVNESKKRAEEPENESLKRKNEKPKEIKEKAKNREEQLILNSLEDQNNPYRAIFEVKKLDEGWDVLNLFDIVRLYETKRSQGKKIPPATVSEAQLIGRGARYYPFQLDDEQPRDQRKFDEDVENELRICEELYYHCQNDPIYIKDLHRALRSVVGVDFEKEVFRREYTLKDSFIRDDLYTRGIVFANKRKVRDRKEVHELSPTIRDNIYSYNATSGKTSLDHAMEGEIGVGGGTGRTRHVTKTLGEIAARNYAIVHKALMKFPIFKFHTLKTYFPNIHTTREFITGKEYLGNVKVKIACQDVEPTIQDMYDASLYVLDKIANAVSRIEETYYGTKEFYDQRIQDVFKDKTIHIAEPKEGGLGYSQNDPTNNPYQIDLMREDWFAYTDHFGTSVEKEFVAYFRDHVQELRKKYAKIYLVRNEREFHIYSFNDGARFEPDFVLFLRKGNNAPFEQIQIFIEPKGGHLIEKDAWKEEFLQQIKERAEAKKLLVDNNKYAIWGFHFFNTEKRAKEFDDDFMKLL